MSGVPTITTRRRIIRQTIVATYAIIENPPFAA
jgi:hypothetical protein